MSKLWGKEEDTRKIGSVPPRGQKNAEAARKKERKGGHTDSGRQRRAEKG